MARVKGKDTRPELIVRRFLWSRGLRYRLHVKNLPGKPDLAFIGRKVAVFVHGCFWHRHPECANARMPKSRTDFWEAKLSGNVERDERSVRALTDRGWTVLTIWECETRSDDKLEAIAAAIGPSEERRKAQND